MTRKTSARTPVRKSIPPLLGALAKPAGLSDSDLLHLKALVALDALHRGNGTSSLLASLGHNLIVSECLCVAGYEKERMPAVREGHAALVRVDMKSEETGRWEAKDGDYAALRAAVEVYGAQLRLAPRAEIRKAQLDMVGVLTKFWPQKAA